MSDTGEDTGLPLLLARLAGLLGHAVPVHRFAMLQETQDGIALESLPLLQRAAEYWQARFPAGEITPRAARTLGRKEVPAIWLARDDARAVLVRARLTNGDLVIEDAAGVRGVLSPAQADQGTILCLGTGHERPEAPEAPGAPRSAGDFFARALRRHRRIFIEAVFATFVLSLIGLASAMYTMQVYDRVVPTKGFSTLWVLTIGVLLAMGLELLMKQVRAQMVDRASKAIDEELSAVFFAKALDIRMDARPRTVGTFAAQIRQFESIRAFMASSTLFILADAPFALLFVGVIALIAGPVALVPLVVTLLALLVGLALRAPLERLATAHIEESNRKNGVLIEAVDGIESVKAAGAEWKLLDRWRALTATLGESELRIRLHGTLAANLTQTLQQLSYVGMVAAGAYAITAGALTMGGLIACTIISGRALAPLAQIPALIVQWKHARIALRALDAIMALPDDRDEGVRLVVPERCEGRLRLDNVAYGFGDERPALTVPALSIAPGERVAVLGPVGSGKSTLIKVLSGLYRPRSGAVFLDDVDMSHLAPAFVREHVGYLPQDVRLFNGSLRDNLCLGLPTPSDSLILEVANLTGLAQVIQRHPRGLELEISEGGRGLSGGQRQLVGLTRLLLMRPRVLLLDEPSAALDAQLELLVMHNLFRTLAPETTIVLVTHKPALVMHARRVILLEQGRIITDGPRDEVLARAREKAGQLAASKVAVRERGDSLPPTLSSTA